MKCKNCQVENSESAKFCSECGNPLVREDATATLVAIDVGDAAHEVEDLPGQLEDLAPGDAMLLVTKGSNVGATYLLDSEVVRVGRHPDNDVFLDDVTVSRKHAEFHRQDGAYSVKDTGSLNGTYVNGKSIDVSALKRGDEVQVGKFKLVFLLGAHNG